MPACLTMTSNPPSQFQIKRKPVGQPPGGRSYHVENERPPLPRSSNTIPNLSDSTSGAQLSPPEPQRAETDQPPTQKSQTPAKDAIHKAYGETRHFLGGLIARPSESNRHFTILRHSHGVVFYHGSTTTVAISIFSDAPLPPDRSLWLQSRGYSGKTGMKAKAFFRLHDDWLNVTPAMGVSADQVSPVDERTWQRDINKFRKKASGRVRDTHQLRETAIARIPLEAGDGYFSILLCKGEKKKLLCTSPVFRVLSTSMDPSSIRGASLSTLPLELGAMVMGLYAQTMAEGAIAPAAAVMQEKISPIQPSWAAQTAAQTAFEASGAGDRIAGVLETSDDQGVYSGHGDSFSVDQGPVEPYPMDFKARGEVPTEGVSAMDGVPKLALRRIPDWVLERFDGYYFCWARYEQKVEKKTTMGAWQPVILNVRHFDPADSSRVNISQAMKRVSSLRFLDEVELPSQMKLAVRVMGFLRPPPPSLGGNQSTEARETAAEAAMLADACDASFVQNILDHPAWAPDVPSAKELQRANTGLKERTQTGLSNAAAGGQKFAEQVPLHWIGVRSPLAEMRDQRVTVNGFYIVR